MTARSFVRALLVVSCITAPGRAAVAQHPPMQPGIAEGPKITALTGLSVPQFEVEMRHFVQGLGVNCGGCHAHSQESTPFEKTAAGRPGAAKVRTGQQLHQRLG